ncbi:uncharacterized protein LOC109540816 [Dendroctonus ponderosae]|uniref:Uncharacterized protein n=1 Tax=Dendroctonus ponderosae TaxID=77166 RepID=U4U043_DENPD|nr:uncharacterized protein LOC109540816 [Dendroctonus ponderosae]ERL86437.1 hypothetical protein D910_03844 [Dendroctonus ponderosae]KAH1028986.1 hypothetical protein HUJ05_002296 [Dendroctonus ponderosae]
MEFSKRTIPLKIRRYDLSDNPETTEKDLIVYPSMDYKAIKAELFKMCEAYPDKQVLKLRNPKNCLIPISFLVENEEPYFIVDVAAISCFGNNSNSLLQDAYVDSVCNRVKFLESRVAQAELLLPQLEWRRQSYMEDTVSGLLNKVQFLNRRFDELYPKYKAGTLVQDLSP